MATKPKQVRIDTSKAVLVELKCTVYLGAIVKGDLCTVIVIPDIDTKNYRIPNVEDD